MTTYRELADALTAIRDADPEWSETDARNGMENLAVEALRHAGRLALCGHPQFAGWEPLADVGREEALTQWRALVAVAAPPGVTTVVTDCACRDGIVAEHHELCPARWQDDLRGYLSAVCGLIAMEEHREPTELVSLSGREWMVLGYLDKRAPECRDNRQISVDVDDVGTRVAVGEAVQALVAKSLAVQHGPRKGAMITLRGRELIARHNQRT